MGTLSSKLGNCIYLINKKSYIKSSIFDKAGAGSSLRTIGVQNF